MESVRITIKTGLPASSQLAGKATGRGVGSSEGASPTSVQRDTGWVERHLSAAVKSGPQVSPVQTPALGPTSSGLSQQATPSLL